MLSPIQKNGTNWVRENFLYQYNYLYTPYQIEVFRILLASFALFSFSTLLLDYPLLFAPDGLIAWEVTNASAYWFELHPLKIAESLSINPATAFWGLAFAYIMALLGLLLGIFPRLCACFALFCFATIANVLAPYGYGVDVYTNVSIFLLVIFPTGYQLSVIKKKENTDTADKKAISIRVLQIYLILTYLSAGSEKAMMASWWNGKFIFLMLSDPTVIDNSIVPLSFPFWCYAIMGIVVVFIESFYFICVWIPMLRSIWVGLIIGMHFFICAVMEMPMFGLLLILLNIACWYPAMQQDWQKWKNNGNKKL